MVFVELLPDIIELQFYHDYIIEVGQRSIIDSAQ
jgi:hypothetical protein